MGSAHEAMWRRRAGASCFTFLPSGGRLITVQLWRGGCSITALDEGQGRSTTRWGSSPLEGLVMATRSGDVDPSILPYLQERLCADG